MKNNVIPRKAIKIAVTFVRDLMDYPKGHTTVVEKNEWGYWSDGKYRYSVGHLRDPEICTLKIIA